MLHSTGTAQSRGHFVAPLGMILCRNRLTCGPATHPWRCWRFCSKLAPRIISVCPLPGGYKAVASCLSNDQLDGLTSKPSPFEPQKVLQ